MSDNQIVPGADSPPPVAAQDKPPVTLPPKIVITFGRRGVERASPTVEATPAVTLPAVRTYRFFLIGMGALTLIFWGALSVPYGLGVLIALAFACCLFAWATLFAETTRNDHDKA
jgi:hypothetical protein